MVTGSQIVGGDGFDGELEEVGGCSIIEGGGYRLEGCWQRLVDGPRHD
jgi:hypothetical protein